MENFDISIFKDKFIEEAAQLLNELENALLELEKEPDHAEHIDTVFRAMHTLKGVGSMYGFDAISAYTHLLESIYDAIRAGKCRLLPDIFDITFQSVDHLRMLLGDEKLRNAELQHTHEILMEQIRQLMSLYSIELRAGKKEDIVNRGLDTTVDDASISVWNILFKCDDSLIIRGIRLLYIFDDLSKTGEFYIERKIDDDADGADGVIWSIFLLTDKPRAEIEDVFMFVEDNIRMVRLSGENIFDEAFAAKLIENEDMPDILASAEDFASGRTHDFHKPLLQHDEGDDSRQDANQEKNRHETAHEARISVSAAKLDNLMFLVSELVTLKSQMKLASERNETQHWKLQVEVLEKLAAQFRSTTLSIRLVPLRELTIRFKRLIRDLSAQLGKKVDFVVQGDEIELDKNAVTALADPIMHLIRNCIDHGIEMPEARLRRNKPETGVVKLSAYQSGNFIFIQIADDGEGINHELVRQKAVEKGLIAENAVLSDQQVHDLIFLPGFSTARSLTNVSGRGVGMDVVRRRITELRGEVTVDSEAGLGASFTIKLQQMLSIVDTLLVRVGQLYFLIPLSDIEICSQISNTEVGQRATTATLPYQNELIPFISLSALFHLPPSGIEKSKTIVIKKQERRFALLADAIVGEHQAVLKPLGETFKNQKYISAASILNDGEMAYLLDTLALQKAT